MNRLSARAHALARVGCLAARLLATLIGLGLAPAGGQDRDYTTQDVIRFFEAIQAEQTGAAPATPDPARAAQPDDSSRPGLGLCLGTPEECAGTSVASPDVGTRGVPVASVPSPAPVTPSPRPTTVASQSPTFDLLVSFEFNSARLTQEARDRLARFAAAIVSPGLESLRFRIEGHTDAIGTVAFNAELSERRAEAVAAFLTQSGVARDRLDMIGYGETMPRVADPFDPRNRRVESRLLPTSMGRAAEARSDGALIERGVEPSFQ